MLWFRLFMTAVILLIPLTMVGFGKLFLNKALWDINYTFGYRTSRSMKNWDTWEFAHRYMGRKWLETGRVLMPLSLIAMTFTARMEDIDRVGIFAVVILFIQMAFLVIPIFKTEKALKENFDEYGVRK